jgi:GT2 family glycosyltransferase
MHAWIDYFIIKRSGLFDAQYYLREYPDIRRADVDPLMHFIKHGWREERNPGVLFNTHAYLESNPELRQKNINPLVHYIRSGSKTDNKQSLQPPETQPRADIDGQKQFLPTRGDGVNRLRVPISLKSLPRLILHGLYYLRVNGFNKFIYRARIQLGFAPRATPRRSHIRGNTAINPYEATYLQSLATATQRDQLEFVDFVARDMKAIPPPVKLIAFYLPQFYPFPENDAWWGKGFTEWTNVSKTVPQFIGHYQPRLPGELGFYDLRVHDVQRRQVELAKNYGIYGFCFHYYWFNGKRLLEKPLDQFVQDPQIDFPFCICWANENWTRKWDGRSADILISQEHSFDNDKLIIHDFVKLFNDPRYIRINGRPLLIVYRADILQNAKTTLEYWRKYSFEHSSENPYIVMAQTFGSTDPRISGFDAAVEFPPHNGAVIPEITNDLVLLNGQYQGRIFRYSDMVLSSMKRIKREPYRRFNTVSPGWDNNARTPGNGLTYTGSTPGLYSQWLDAACRFALSSQPEGERFVFINAWNEWAEAAYIEPDRKFGYAYLQSTADVLDGLLTAKFQPNKKIEGAADSRSGSAKYYQQMVTSISSPSVLDATIAQYTTKGDPDQIQRLSLSIDQIFSTCVVDETTILFVSIIIPVYNHFEATQSCLKSILAAQDDTPIEIIIIDDGSSDESYELFTGCKTIRYIHNENNLGFLASCNKAAEMARGQYIVLLNNDTMVLPGWLDSIMDTFRDNPGTGLVGSKLIYPDGRLQEAGGLIWKDASGNNFGRDDDPNHPQYNYLRDADYCSGACICVPKSLWDELHGFDELYTPAYYEDTDLAFRIRDRGYAVLYQPFSCVIHSEGVTAGTNIASGIKKYQELNREKFYARWKDILLDHGDGLQPSILYRNHVRRNRALLIDVCTPKPDHDAGSIDTYNYLLVLRKIGFEVTFISVVDSDLVDHYVEDLQKRGIECIYAPYLVSINEYIKHMGKYYDLVLLFRAPYGGQYIDAVRKYAPQAKVVFNTVDLHFLREIREEMLSGKGLKLHAHLTRSDEISIMKKADRSVVVSEFEQNYLASMNEKINLIVIPLSTEVPGRTANFDGRNNIVFIGGYLHRPNVDAVLYFVRDIWPLISAELIDCEFWIVGSNITKELEQLTGEKIKAIGFVPDLSDVFSKVKISIAPLRFGAGIKGKILTSLSYGVPCVASTIAAEGMGLTNGVNAMIGDSPDEFAKAVVKVYTERATWERLSDNGLSFVNQNYSLSNFENNLMQLVKDLGLEPHQPVKNPQ